MEVGSDIAATADPQSHTHSPLRTHAHDPGQRLDSDRAKPVTPLPRLCASVSPVGGGYSGYGSLGRGSCWVWLPASRGRVLRTVDRSTHARRRTAAAERSSEGGETCRTQVSRSRCAACLSPFYRSDAYTWEHIHLTEAGTGCGTCVQVVGRVRPSLPSDADSRRAGLDEYVGRAARAFL